MSAVLGLFALFAMIGFFVGLVCLIRPIRAIRIPTRRRAVAVIGVSFIVIIAIIAVSPTTDPEPALRKQAETQTSEPGSSAPAVTHQPESEAIQSTQAIIQKAPRTEVEWNAHTFKVVKDEDISFSNRLRRRIVIVAPEALTREDRIATLIEAARQAWKKHNSQYIALFLLPFELGPTIARIDYAPDKCGISGEDCSDRVWTDAYASDLVFTPELEQLYTMWENNKNRFKELDKDFGFETVNEEKLKAFLAEQFTTQDEIWNAIVRVTAASAKQQEMMIPRRLEQLGHLDDQDQKKAEEKACRGNLQCWGDKHSIAASMYCSDYIERLAKYDYEWIDGWLESKFSRFAWDDRQTGSLTYIGDQIQFQNVLGAWIRHTYNCDFDPLKQKVLDVRAGPGRLRY